MKKSILGKLSVAAAVSAALSLSPAASALDIALTNDDGWSTYGIHALYNALTAAGHTVTLAGPLAGESGSSAAIDVEAILESALSITKRAENIYSVGALGGSAEPATAGIIATNLSVQTNGSNPDLLVSGINDGANVGGATQISGTVGAAIVSIGRVVGDSIPAIAISTDERCAFEEPDDPADAVVPAPEDIPAGCTEVADFVVALIDELEGIPQYKSGKSGLLPDGMALNVNYPPGAPLGAKTAVQGRLPFIAQLGGAASLDVGCYGDCVNVPVGATIPGGILGATPITEGDIKQADNELFAEGYITIVAIEADYTASSNNSKSLLGQLNKFFKQY